MRKLYIGNKNYSSWSMRPWVLLTQAGIPFEEIVIRFDAFDAGSDFRKAVSSVNPAGKVPVLDDDGLVIWDTGQLIWRDQPAVRADVARLVAMWQELLAAHPGGMLFGEFGIADAFYAPVCMRLKSYALPVPSDIAAYIERLCALPGVKAWIDGALAENDFRAFEEPYRLER